MVVVYIAVCAVHNIQYKVVVVSMHVTLAVTVPTHVALYMFLLWVSPLLYIVCYACTVCMYCSCGCSTATFVGTAVALYCLLCTAGTATCMGTAITLYCMLCTVNTVCLHFILYALYALRLLSHAWALPLLYTVDILQVLLHAWQFPYVCIQYNYSQGEYIVASECG